MLRVIQLTTPTWVIAENVRGLLTIERGVVFEQVCLDLETAGYEVQPFIIPAVSVNAPHRRDRVWFVAKNTKYDGGGIREDEKQTNIGDERDTRAGNGTGISCRANAQNTNIKRGSGGMEGGGQILERESPEAEDARPSWETNWLEVASRLYTLE